jgi:hypothetical protein
MLELYELFKTVVVTYQAATVKTFAALNDPAAINAANLNKSQAYAFGNSAADIFYSKKWQDENYNANRLSFDYPAIFAFSRTLEYLQGVRITYPVRLYFVAPQFGADKNTPFEFVDAQLENISFTFLDKLRTAVQLADGTWVFEPEPTDTVKRTILEVWKNSATVKIEREMLGVDDLAGVWCELEFQLTRC